MGRDFENQEGPVVFRESDSPWPRAVLIGMGVVLLCTAIIYSGFVTLREEIYNVKVVQCAMLAPGYHPAGYCPEVPGDR